MTQSQATLGCLHNTPFTDMNDSEDDLQPMVYSAFDDAERSLKLLAGVLEEVEVCTDRMAACADANFLAVTELADTLVRSTGMSFHTALFSVLIVLGFYVAMNLAALPFLRDAAVRATAGEVVRLQLVADITKSAFGNMPAG